MKFIVINWRQLSKQKDTLQLNTNNDQNTWCLERLCTCMGNNNVMTKMFLNWGKFDFKRNPVIFEYDYEKMRANCSKFRDELRMKIITNAYMRDYKTYEKKEKDDLFKQQVVYWWLSKPL